MIRLRNFKGRLPKLHKDVLPPGYAQIADRCNLVSGVLRPWPSPGGVQGTVPASSQYIAYLAGAWRGFTHNLTRIVQGPVDTTRYYISAPDLAEPRLRSYAGAGYDRRLRLVAPTSRPEIPGVSIEPGAVIERVRFCHTYVTDLGEESRPGPLSITVALTNGAQVPLIFSDETIPGDRGITRRRFYRTVSVGDGPAELHLVGSAPIATDSFTYNNLTTPLQEVCPSIDYDTPRDDMRSFTAMANGIIAGISGRTLCFCEPYIPHAWPRKYELVMDAPIVGLASFGSSLVVLTSGAPHIVTGSHPANMSVRRFEDGKPCINARSIVDRGYSVLYAAPEGLVEISENGCRVVTEGLFDAATWQSQSPNSWVSAVFHEGRHVWITLGTAGPTGTDMGIIDLSGQEPYYLRNQYASRAIALHPTNGRISFLPNIPGTLPIEIFSRNATGAPDMTYRWRSGVMREPYLTSFGWCLVRADRLGDQDVTVRLYGGQPMSLIATVTQANVPVRLPAGRLDQEFEVEIEGDGVVREVSFANSPEELVSA